MIDLLVKNKPVKQEVQESESESTGLEDLFENVEKPKAKKSESESKSLNALFESGESEDLEQPKLERQNAVVENRPRRNASVGVPLACNKESLIRVKSAVMHLRRKGILVDTFRPYTENIVSCEQQLVAGMNYFTVVSINHHECKLDMYVDLENNTKIMLNQNVEDAHFTKRPTLYQGNLKECAELFGTEKIQGIFEN